jgi:hypothetical protein
MKVLKWLGYTVLVLIIISIPAYWWLAIESHIPSSAHYSIDMTAVRRLADAGVVDLPVAIRVTWLVGEDREAVMREFVELHRLHAAEPDLNMMPGHDPAELTRFLKAGLLTKGF